MKEYVVNAVLILIFAPVFLWLYMWGKFYDFYCWLRKGVR